MKIKSQKFGDLLTEGIYAIQKAELFNKKKNLDIIQRELSEAINRQVSTIEYYRKGNVPTSQFEIEQLAREIFKRGRVGEDWLEHFLKNAKHINWLAVKDELFIPGTNILERDESYSYQRTKLYISKQILPEGFSETLKQTEIEVIGDNELSVIRHRVINLSSPIEQFKLDFQQGYRKDGGEITARVLAIHDHICVWAIEFTPPLAIGQKASYSYKTYGRYYSSTAEDVESQYKNGRRSKKFELWSVKIAAPTDELEMQILFPLNFSIALPPTGGFSVYAGTHEQIKEKAFIKEKNGFVAKFDEKLRRWTMTLNVSPAHFGYVYELQWIPPHN